MAADDAELARLSVALTTLAGTDVFLPGGELERFAVPLGKLAGVDVAFLTSTGAGCGRGGAAIGPLTLEEVF